MAILQRIFRRLAWELSRIREWIHFRIRIWLRPQVSVAGVTVPTGPHLSGEVMDTLEDGSYEESELELLNSILRPEDVVLELGAGIGFISTFCAKKLGSGQVFGYEANPLLGPAIARMHAVNGVAPNVQLCALGKEAGFLELNVSRHFWHSTTVGQPIYGKTRSFRVPVKSFDEEFAAIRPTVVVVDIEGGELELLALRPETLCQPRVWVIEFHPLLIGEDKIDQIKQRLVGLGYSEIAGDRSTVAAFGKNH